MTSELSHTIKDSDIYKLDLKHTTHCSWYTRCTAGNTLCRT